VDIRELKINTALAAVTTWGLADRSDPLGKRLSRAEMDRLLKETHLDEKMKQQGYWSPGKMARGQKTITNEMPKETEKHTASDAAASILAIDYGRARIGLAIAGLDAQLPRPLLTLERVNRNEDMRRLRELAREHSVRQIVVGLPLRLDGTRGEMAEEATRFAARLTKQLAYRST